MLISPVFSERGEMSFGVEHEVARSLEQWLIIKIMFFSGWLVVFYLFFYFMCVSGLLYVLCALRICLVLDPLPPCG